jgi:hypothetical protein
MSIAHGSDAAEVMAQSSATVALGASPQRHDEGSVDRGTPAAASDVVGVANRPSEWAAVADRGSRVRT